MTLHEQRFQGTPGARLTTATSSGGDSTPYSLVNAPHVAAVTHSDDVTNPVHGGTVGRFDGTLGVPAEVRWVVPDVTTIAQSAVVMFPEKPAAGEGVLDWLYARGTVRNSSVRLMDATDGRLRLYRRDSSTTGQISSAAMTALLGEWIVVDHVVTIGESTSSGTLMLRVRRLDDLDGPPLLDYVATDQDTGVVGTHVLDHCQLGKTSGTSGLIAPFYVADHRLDDTATTYLPDPPLYTEETPEQLVTVVDGVWVSHDPITVIDGVWVPSDLV